MQKCPPSSWAVGKYYLRYLRVDGASAGAIGEYGEYYRKSVRGE